MEYEHSGKSGTYYSNAFKAGIAVNIVFVVVEAVFGKISNSMALVSDAGHNFSDVLVLVFSWIAILLSQKKPSIKFTYGLRRLTILAALLNTLILIAAVVLIAIETINRIRHPVSVDSSLVIIVALIAILINGITAWLFKKGQKEDLNIRSAFLHFIADTIVSLGVVITGLIISLTGIYWIDSIVSFIILIVILYSTYRLMLDSVNLALDAVPENINIMEVRSFLENLPEVSDFHDLHIWAMSTTSAALTVHLTTKIPTDVKFIRTIQANLRDKFNIEHSTIQVEFGENASSCNNCN
ncbi:MAG: cation diffusion facilitator family transporter [Bacteroidota bacterium]|nr:cation diffusion facilitator family transporter [Bacteroidota bacterium]